MPEKNKPIWSIKFFKTASGSEPVRVWIKKHSKAEMKVIGEDIKTVQFSAQWSAPLVKYLASGLYEIRSDLFYTTARVFFFIDGRELILVHGITKKTQKTSKDALDLALKRKRIYEQQK